jgi:hypothetical protein
LKVIELTCGGTGGADEMTSKVDQLNGTLGAIETELLRRQNAALKDALALDDDDEDDEDDDEDGADEASDDTGDE